ncbi:PIN-like domain-containing protein [Zavarzinella formosa]|uniref:PIN-like domain-containing protein n=1 Tax=Zavarzinella formosa TaxID=360055 RepID=UPI0002D4DE97|nr:PIN domain-containing protein [Zavarzinella formosa]
MPSDENQTADSGDAQGVNPLKKNEAPKAGKGKPVPAEAEKPENNAQKPKGDVDLFWLETIFPKPEDIFTYRSPSPEELAKTAVFGLDANVLLAPSLMGSESVANLEVIYLKLAQAKRLFAPAQAVREYGKNRARKVADVSSQVYNRLSSLPTVQSLDCPMLEGIAEYTALKELGAAIREKTKAYKEKLNLLQQILADWGWNDKVSELYREVFTGLRIVDHSLSQVQIREDLSRRLARKIPPGYKDGGKPDEGVGDLLIWHTLIQLAKDKQKPVIFVCNEEKADWFVRSNDRPLMPRPELTHEFFQETGFHFTIMSWSRFLKSVDATDRTVHEAEQAKIMLGQTYYADDKLIDSLNSYRELLGVFNNMIRLGANDTGILVNSDTIPVQAEHCVRVIGGEVAKYTATVTPIDPDRLRQMQRLHYFANEIKEEVGKIIFLKLTGGPRIEHHIGKFSDRYAEFLEHLREYEYYCNDPARS